MPFLKLGTSNSSSPKEGKKEPQPAAYCHRWQLGEGPRTLEEGRGAVNSTSSLWHGGLEGKVQLTLFFCPHLQGHLPLQKKCTRGKVHLAEMNENRYGSPEAGLLCPENKIPENKSSWERGKKEFHCLTRNADASPRQISRVLMKDIGKGQVGLSNAPFLQVCSAPGQLCGPCLTFPVTFS